MNPDLGLFGPSQYMSILIMIYHALLMNINLYYPS